MLALCRGVPVVLGELAVSLYALADEFRDDRLLRGEVPATLDDLAGQIEVAARHAERLGYEFRLNRWHLPPGEGIVT
jgi:hypothetical protein